MAQSEKDSHSKNRGEKAYLGFPARSEKTVLYSHRTRLELLSAIMAAQLICVFVLVWAKIQFSQDAIHMVPRALYVSLGLKK